ncbi:MAG: divalent metal cation transporter [Candidatus Kapabacteria bacterium]|nr:divalent metal cation transporter [Candidatus Kapabacteria bacterium]
MKTDIRQAPSRIKRFWKTLGPGLVTGASDDDPSGIATYSQAGAQFGLMLLWTAAFTYPMMVVVQEMCARIGIVTKQGLTATIKQHYPRPMLWLIIALSFPAITLNIGADIAGMGAVGNLLIPQVPSWIFSVVSTAVLMYTIISFSYRRIASVLKWLCLTLLSYILIPFLVDTDWALVLQKAVVPSIQFDRAFLLVLVGILGTTISPYLFFWQTSMEVEEGAGRNLVVDKVVITEMNTDVRGGMFFTTVVFFFIILTSGTVLHSAGILNITTVEDAAKSLRPLAGEMSYALFAIGVIGTGFLAIPVLAGALSYMVAETFGWKEGLNKKFTQAPGFYLTMIASLIIGLMIDVTNVSPITALIYTAVLYGVTAPVLIALVMHVCNRRSIMGAFTNSLTTNVMGAITLIVMIAAAILFIGLWVME